MKINNSLIKKFLDNQCTAGEAAAVARYLKKHPQLMEMYVRSSWEEADKESGVPTGYQDDMWAAIDTQMRKDKRVVRFRWMSIAASLLILILIALFKPETKTVQTQVAKTTDKSRLYTNTSHKPLQITLQDGSSVKLAPNAAIKEVFTVNKRDIYLQGEASFDVTHDTTKPFTVHSKLFATTALGTSFSVSEYTVKLFTGKVVVKSPVLKQDVVLLPGHQLGYNPATKAVAVQQFNDTQKKTSKAVGKVKIDEEKIVFDNAPLPDVMRALMQKYQTPIQYDEKLLRSKYFSGEVLKEDSLSTLLKVIANMNDLQVAQKDNGYIISKSK